MEFTVPTFQAKETKIGIYKIWFDDKWFYIGSSKNLRSRFSTWKANLTTGKFKSINIRKILTETSIVRFEVIQVYKSASWLRRNETKEINKHWDNPLFLNRCPDANSPKNMRPYFGYVKPAKKLKGIPEYMQPRKIALFTQYWNLIKIFPSISDFCRHSKFRSSTVKNILEGKRGQHKKLKIKRVAPDGSFIDPITFIPKQQKRHIPKGKPFVQMYPSGKFVALHSSLGVAAKKLGCSKQLIQRILKGRGGGRNKTAKGYIFKYA